MAEQLVFEILRACQQTRTTRLALYSQSVGYSSTMNEIHHNDRMTFLKDHFLIAMPGLQDTYFSQTVAYICEHSPEGAMGLVVNQPIDLQLPQMLQQLDIEPDASVPKLPIFRGGPVQPENGFVLHPASRSWKATQLVSGNLALTTSRDILESIAAGGFPDPTLIALGYAGWGPGQLEGELAANSWLVVPAAWEVLFVLPPNQRWEAAAQLIGVNVHLISQVAGHA
jgi:putative transcriptional regulator